MYKQELKNKIITEVRGATPFIKIGIRFNDYFTEDTYVLVSESDGKSSKKIPFSFFKNNEKVSESIMLDWNATKLMEDFCNSINDIDFHKHFNEKEKSKIIKEVNDLQSFYNNLILLNEVNLEGEMKRMQEIAGISKKPLL